MHTRGLNAVAQSAEEAALLDTAWQNRGKQESKKVILRSSLALAAFTLSAFKSIFISQIGGRSLDKYCGYRREGCVIMKPLGPHEVTIRFPIVLRNCGAAVERWFPPPTRSDDR